MACRREGFGPDTRIFLHPYNPGFLQFVLDPDLDPISKKISLENRTQQTFRKSKYHNTLVFSLKYKNSDGKRIRKRAEFPFQLFRQTPLSENCLCLNIGALGKKQKELIKILCAIFSDENIQIMSSTGFDLDFGSETFSLDNFSEYFSDTRLFSPEFPGFLKVTVLYSAENSTTRNPGLSSENFSSENFFDEDLDFQRMSTEEDISLPDWQKLECLQLEKDIKTIKSIRARYEDKQTFANTQMEEWRQKVLEKTREIENLLTGKK